MKEKDPSLRIPDSHYYTQEEADSLMVKAIRNLAKKYKSTMPQRINKRKKELQRSLEEITRLEQAQILVKEDLIPYPSKYQDWNDDCD